ncbi:GNAT family N-acetyltransferase [Amphiplicatus metriothermophilus]|uniref:Ribosomal-protein-alanine N-acetyltransferase n=1 Tax=Amphiplicatus metriothermophilus TaxID=1519374 RepID=A0A239PPI1_9PROT|nr:GNAT family protein [Amphiplicatus metriothermophilus]MBB5518668.1 ribosomal-protein-alanine N-acetyltransferase [Amphiplicatus metriothermophilus]SNT72175.1 ribosomal-protein-alanine N-acetyltransferase [Amphiplicatus metriothermophilus]
MVLLDIAMKPPDGPMLVRDPVALRVAEYADYSGWTDLRRESRAHLARWEPAWTEADLTPAAFRARVRNQWRDIRRGRALPLLICRREDGTLVGGIDLSKIRYGAARAASVGYWIGAPYLRRGYARAALEAVLDHAFETMRLNRIEAACQPENAPSRALLEKCGFQREGYARAYLKINEAWRDHLLYAAIAADRARRREHCSVMEMR